MLMYIYITYIIYNSTCERLDRKMYVRNVKVPAALWFYWYRKIIVLIEYWLVIERRYICIFFWCKIIEKLLHYISNWFIDWKSNVWNDSDTNKDYICRYHIFLCKKGKYLLLWYWDCKLIVTHWISQNDKFTKTDSLEDFYCSIYCIEGFFFIINLLSNRNKKKYWFESVKCFDQKILFYSDKKPRITKHFVFFLM